MSGPIQPRRAELCTVQRVGNMLRLNGEIDHANAAAITIRLAAEVRLGADHLDLSGVTFCGAACVRALLVARSALPTEAAGLVLTCSPPVFRVLHLAGVATMNGMVVLPDRSIEGRRRKAGQ